MVRNRAEQRMRDRRYGRGGGRRASDRPARQPDAPHCPACREAATALQAGEAEGGWWFVCMACDHLWDQRSRISEREHATA